MRKPVATLGHVRGRGPEEMPGGHDVWEGSRSDGSPITTPRMESVAFGAYSTGERTRSFLKVQDGCDNFCAYCTVPYARGRSRSIPVCECVKMARDIAAKGVKEVVLTGVNTGDFGRTSRETFLDLLKALKVFVSIQVGRRSNVNVIRKLINYGLWRFALDEGGTGTSVEFEDGDGRFIEGKDYEKYLKRQKKEAVLYQRGYIEKWKKLGWIEKSSINGKRYELTETGKRYVEIFCSDVVFKIDSQNL